MNSNHRNKSPNKNSNKYLNNSWTYGGNLKQRLWILFLSLYPIITTAIIYFHVLKGAGYAGVILIPMAGLYLICCFIVNVVFVNLFGDKEKQSRCIYWWPMLTPILSGFALMLSIFS